MRTHALIPLPSALFAGAVLGICLFNAQAMAQCDVWSSLGSGTNGPVHAFTVFGSYLVVGGDFTTAGGQHAEHIAVWNGASWSSQPPGMDGPVYALTVYDGDLIAGGYFTHAGATRVQNIARWTGSGWEAMNAGFSGGAVSALAVYNGELIAAGDYTSPTGKIARWDDSRWQPLGGGILGFSVWALAVHDGDLFAGGLFGGAGGNVARNIARWDGVSWSAVEGGVYYQNAPCEFLTAYVRALAVHGDSLVVGGSFNVPAPAESVARWDGGWYSLGDGLSNYCDPWVGGPVPSPPKIYALAGTNDEMFVGGSFWHDPCEIEDNIARLDGSRWAWVGGGFNGPVLALTVYGGQLIAGGEFTRAIGGLAGGYTNHVARKPLPVVIVEHPQSIRVPEGQNAVMAVVASSGLFDYQWRKDGQPLSNGGRISGATTRRLTISAVTFEDFGAYDVRITNPCGDVFSAPAALGINGSGGCPRRPGDLNCDGLIDNEDIDPFVLALTNPAAYAAAWPNCNILNADINGDGLIDNEDIDPFVTLLSAG